MNQDGGRALGQGNLRPRILAAIGAAGAILIVGAGGAYVLAQPGPDALAAAAWALITMGLVGLIVMIHVVAVRQSLAGHEPRSGYGRGDDPRSGPAPVSGAPIYDLDAELFRILDDTRLGDISRSRRAHGLPGETPPAS